MSAPFHRSRRPGRGRALGVAVVVVATVLCLLAVALLLRHQSLSGLPRAEVESARRALRHAELAAAVPVAPPRVAASLAAARRRAAALELALAETRAAPWPPRRFPALVTAARATRAAAVAIVESRRLHDRQTAVRAVRVLDEAEALLLAPTAGLSRFPADRALRMAVRRGGIEVERGRAAVVAGEAAPALAAAGRAMTAATEAQERLDVHTGRLRQSELLDRWDRWVGQALAASHGAPSVLVDKAAGRTYLLRGGGVETVFASDSGRGGLAPKRHAGDAATPEGVYRVVEKRDRGATRYHRALLLDYPNREDRDRFAVERRAGRVPPGRGIGGLIEIHGDGGRGVNWTDGCVALANPDMDRLFAAVGEGTPVVIVGRALLPPGGETWRAGR